MAKTRDLLTRVGVEVASRRRKCHHNRKHAVPKGDSCLVIKEQSGAKKNYCAVCAGPILDLLEKRLGEFRAKLPRSGHRVG